MIEYIHVQCFVGGTYTVVCVGRTLSVRPKGIVVSPHQGTIALVGSIQRLVHGESMDMPVVVPCMGRRGKRGRGGGKQLGGGDRVGKYRIRHEKQLPLSASNNKSHTIVNESSKPCRGWDRPHSTPPIGNYWHLFAWI